MECACAYTCNYATIKGKVHYTPLQSVGGCSSLSSRRWVRRWRTTNVCDAWPVRRQTHGYLLSCKTSPPIGWYQNILFGDRGTGVLTLATCPGLHSIAQWPGFEPAAYGLQVQHSNLSATEPCDWLWQSQWTVLGQLLTKSNSITNYKLNFQSVIQFLPAITFSSCN